jgi:5S rRNA maturation endonuclease (ribonuclease M5)
VDDALDLVLGKLEGIRQQGGYWMARCPARDHHDQKASLSVARGTEQPVIFKCHAGCHRDDILDGLGLTLDDVSTPKEQRDRGEWTPFGEAVAVYDYTDEHGELLYQVCRTADKQFPQRRKDGSGNWKWRLGDARRVPYRLPKILAAVGAGTTVYIVEGEKDVHSIERAGGVATSSPGGAGKWRDDYDEWFRGADVVIVADRDEPGRDHAADVQAHLRGIAKSVTITEAADGKDASDHLAAGLSLAELVPLRPASRAFAVIDLEPAAEYVDPPTLICRDLLYLGGVHTLTGPPDCGKTTLACWWMLQAIRDGATVLFLDRKVAGRSSSRSSRPLARGRASASHTCSSRPAAGTPWTSPC